MSLLDKMSKGEARALKELDSEVKHLESLKNYPPSPTAVVNHAMDLCDCWYYSLPARRHGEKLLVRALKCLAYAVYGSNITMTVEYTPLRR